MGELHSHFRCRGGGKACTDHIDSAGKQGTNNELLDHGAGQAGVLPHDHFVAVAVRGGFPGRQSSAVSGGKFNYIKTNGASIVSKDAPADAIQKMKQIFDSGTTVWLQLGNVGNFGLSNDPIK